MGNYKKTRKSTKEECHTLCKNLKKTNECEAWKYFSSSNNCYTGKFDKDNGLQAGTYSGYANCGKY